MTSLHHRLVFVLFCLFGFGLVPAAHARTIDETSQAALRVHVVRDGSAVDAVCVLVRREERVDETVLYFVTTARLFKGPHGEPLSNPQAISVTIDDERVIDVRPEDVSLPSAAAEVAVFKAAVRETALTPPLLTFTVPGAGASFFVSGFDVSGAAVEAVQRVSGAATLTVVGDRSLLESANCKGAAAVADRGVFGVVTSCDDGVRPVVAPFSTMGPWIGLYVPGGLEVQDPVATQFEVKQREFSGPFLTVACGEAKTGDLEVPFILPPGEAAVDASAVLRSRSSLRLGDVSVVRLKENLVALRFTMVGEDPPHFPTPVPCPQGQALVTIHIDAVSLPLP